MQSVVKISNINKQHIVYVVGWTLYYAWALVFATVHMSSKEINAIFASNTRLIIHASLLFCAALAICIIKREWFARILKTCSPLLLVAFLAFLLAPDQFKPILAVTLGALFGLMNAGILIPFAFILNNSEKLYALLFGSLLAGVYALLFQTGWIPEYVLVPLAVVLLCIALVPFYFFKTQHFDCGILALPATKAKPIVFLTLIINLIFALIVLGTGKELLDYVDFVDPQTKYIWFYSGGLIACLICYLIFRFARQNVQIVWSITFCIFIVGALVFAFGTDNYWADCWVAILFGIAIATGCFNMYYNIGVISKKYNNINYVRLPLLLGAFGGIFFVFISWLFETVGSASMVASILVICAIILLVYFVALPILSQTYFAETWLKDSDSVEVEAKRLSIFERYSLTQRERQIATLLLSDMPAVNIARELGIGKSTVNFHSANLYRKLGIQSRTQLVTMFAGTIAETKATGE